ncbi:MAG TPA: GTPase Era [Gammaproteobacteria bacterium]|nr:GTPase Era [Gammaproteobacteria bacterium]
MTTNRCGYAAIVGRPNVGKSTLLNQMIGQKIAITSHKPQTTRHAILGIRTLKQGQIVFVDTPGIHRRGAKGLNRVLNQTAERMLHDVDVILFVVQADVWTEEDEAVLTSIRRSGKPAILVVNKIDLLERKESLLAYLSGFNAADFVEMIPVSAIKHDNVDIVEKMVLAHLPQSSNFFPEDQITDKSERFMAAELLREQLTRRYAKEIPYALTVEIERFESTGERYRIGAVIWVEREGQKRIIIGKKGAALKESARIARESMESCFGRKVWLDVWVKVKKSWSSDEAALSSLGYLDP